MSERPAPPTPLLNREGRKLRRATLADVGAVQTLVRQAYAKWVPLIGREPRPMQDFPELGGTGNVTVFMSKRLEGVPK